MAEIGVEIDEIIALLDEVLSDIEKKLGF